MSWINAIFFLISEKKRKRFVFLKAFKNQAFLPCNFFYREYNFRNILQTFLRDEAKCSIHAQTYIKEWINGTFSCGINVIYTQRSKW